MSLWIRLPKGEKTVVSLLNSFNRSKRDKKNVYLLNEKIKSNIIFKAE